MLGFYFPPFIIIFLFYLIKRVWFSIHSNHEGTRLRATRGGKAFKCAAARTSQKMVPSALALGKVNLSNLMYQDFSCTFLGYSHRDIFSLK